MFIEFETKRKERFFVNLNQILYVTEEKDNAVIVDVSGFDYALNCTYDEVKSVINRHLESIKFANKFKTWQNV